MVLSLAPFNSFMATSSTLLRRACKQPMHRVYDVKYLDEHITTTVTYIGDVVDRWIAQIERLHKRRLDQLTVGLDIECISERMRKERAKGKDDQAKSEGEGEGESHKEKGNKVTILQLCVGHKCLIYQLRYIDRVPESLLKFLKTYRFVGVAIQQDIEKLGKQYGFLVSNIDDLTSLAANVMGNSDYMGASLKKLAQEVLRKELVKKRNIIMSGFAGRRLSHKQVQYACVDAFVAFEIARRLTFMQT